MTKDSVSLSVGNATAAHMPLLVYSYTLTNTTVADRAGPAADDSTVNWRGITAALNLSSTWDWSSTSPLVSSLTLGSAMQLPAAANASGAAANMTTWRLRSTANTPGTQLLLLKVVAADGAFADVAINRTVSGKHVVMSVCMPPYLQGFFDSARQ